MVLEEHQQLAVFFFASRWIVDGFLDALRSGVAHHRESTPALRMLNDPLMTHEGL